MEEIDMFADLEQTLCEGLTTLQFNRDKVNSKHNDIDVSCLEDVRDLSKLHGPAVRAFHLYKAMVAYQEKRFLDSVYYESFALSLHMRIKFYANKIMEDDQHMPTNENLINFLEDKQKAQSSEMIGYLDRFLKYMDNDMSKAVKPVRNIDFVNGTEMMKICAELPDEWTVIQLCKELNPEVYEQSRDETIKYPSSIYMTLLRYPMSERFDHQPIKILLNRQDIEELYETSHKYYVSLNGNNYAHNKVITEQQFEEDIVNKLKKLLGPWFVCFSGKCRKVSVDSNLIHQAEAFLADSEQKYSKRQVTLIHLIARRVYMLKKEYLKEAALYISSDKHQYWELWDFFEDLQLRNEHNGKAMEDTYPVILVIDEHLDHMFWEMCNTNQEFTRVDSLTTLFKLYFHHQDRMTNGYYRVKGRTSSVVMNPDGTLPQFPEYVHPLIKVLPNTTWTHLIDKEPTFADLKSMLSKSDVHVYLGHGSGLQFISAYETSQLTTDAVVFLMGCSSVAYRTNCGYSFGTAAHHCYHIAKSPAVIGHLNLTYVTFGSALISIMLARWLTNLKQIDKSLFESKDESYVRKLEQLIAGHPHHSPYLSKVIACIRRSCHIPITFRAILCHRGLPVVLSI